MSHVGGGRSNRVVGRSRRTSRTTGNSSQPDSVRSGQGAYRTNNNRIAVGSNRNRDGGDDAQTGTILGAQAGATVGAEVGMPAAYAAGSLNPVAATMAVGAIMGGALGYTAGGGFGPSQGNERVGSGRNGSGDGRLTEAPTRTTQQRPDSQSAKPGASDDTDPPGTTPAPVRSPGPRRGSSLGGRGHGASGTLLTGGQGVTGSTTSAVRTLLGI